MKKDNQQRLILNIIILVISAFILIFMLLGKFLSSSDPVSIIQLNNSKNINLISEATRDTENA